MHLDFIKPNAKNTGFKLSLFQAHKDGGLMITMVQQYSWDQEKRVGYFATQEGQTKEKVFVTLKAEEIGAILTSIKHGKTWLPYNARKKNAEGKEIGTFYHRHSKQVTRIKFEVSNEGERTYWFKIQRQNPNDSSDYVNFAMRLDLGEGEMLRIFLEELLRRQYNWREISEAKNGPPEKEEDKKESDGEKEETPKPEDTPEMKF